MINDGLVRSNKLNGMFKEFAGELEDDRLMALVQLAIAGHMTVEQQDEFLKDAEKRGLL